MLLCGLAFPVHAEPLQIQPQKLSLWQKYMVGLTGLQANQSSFKRAFQNILVVKASGIGADILESKLKIPAPLSRYAGILWLRSLNSAEGLQICIKKAFKEYMLTGAVESLASYLARSLYPASENPLLNNNPLKYTAQAASAVSAAYIYKTGRDLLAQVEEECTDLDIESGVRGGVLPEDDSWLLIPSPLNTSLGAGQLAVVLANPFLGIPMNVTRFVTHFGGRTFIPHSTFVKLSPELQEKLVDFSMLNFIANYL